MKSASEASQFYYYFFFAFFPHCGAWSKLTLSSTLRDFWQKDQLKLPNTDRHANDHAECTRARALPLLNLKKKRDCSQSPRYFVTITNLSNFTRFKRYFAFRYAIEGLTVDGLPSCGCKAVIFNTHKAQL